MFFTLQIAAVFLTALAMSLPLAHALELPGKLRLDRQAYMTVQPIYYPGFTIGGGFGEGLAMAATLALLIMTPVGSAAFAWTLAAFVALIAMHAAYWIITHPVNKFWLKDQQLKGLGAGFFAIGPSRRDNSGSSDTVNLWKRYRDRWEYSHVVRAVLAAIALVAIIVAVVI